MPHSAAHDEDAYDPKSYSGTEQTTPSTRAMEVSTPNKAKVRVNSVLDGLDSKRRCLITNVDCAKATDYAHVLGRALGHKDELMTMLEFSWKKKYKTQNIHTRYNLFCLSAKFHRLFDAEKWLLLPETRILDRYEKVLEEPHLFPTIEEGTYRYRLVAHPDMKNVPIHRRDETLPISPNAFEKFVYPFEEFPTIVSHVHPRFVICNAALKFKSIETLFEFAGAKKGKLHDALLKVTHIYEEWSKAPLLPHDFRRERNVPQVQPRPTIDRQGKDDVAYVESSDEEGKAPSTPATIATTSAFRSVRAYSIENETPRDRARDSDLEDAKVRVDKVAAKRCLLENTDEANAHDYAHLLDRGSPDKILTALEYSWGMDYYTLNVDSRYNLFCLSRTLHRLFDANAWLLVPEAAIVDEYHTEITKRAEFPSLERPKFPSLENHQPPYSYTLVANHLMTQVPIHVQRSKEDANDNEVNDMIDFNLADAFVCHTHPFHQFPVIRSHVHPRFVICNTGGKLKKSVYIAGQFHVFSPPHVASALTQIKTIYDSWTKLEIVPSEFTVGRALHQQKPSDDPPDDKTEPRRSRYSRRCEAKEKRTSPPLAEDGPSKPTKRAKSGGANDSVWLDDATLGELEPDRSPKKAWHDKVAWIQTWVGQVPMDATVEEVPMDIEAVDKLTCQTFDDCASDSDSELEDMESLLSA